MRLLVTDCAPTRNAGVDIWPTSSTTVHTMSTASVLIAPDHTETRRSAGPRYTLLLTNDSTHIEAAQRLRYEVFSTEPGFAFANDTGFGRRWWRGAVRWCTATPEPARWC